MKLPSVATFRKHIDSTLPPRVNAVNDVHVIDRFGLLWISVLVETVLYSSAAGSGEYSTYYFCRFGTNLVSSVKYVT